MDIEKELFEDEGNSSLSFKPAKRRGEQEQRKKGSKGRGVFRFFIIGIIVGILVGGFTLFIVWSKITALFIA